MEEAFYFVCVLSAGRLFFSKLQLHKVRDKVGFISRFIVAFDIDKYRQMLYKINLMAYYTPLHDIPFGTLMLLLLNITIKFCICL